MELGYGFGDGIQKHFLLMSFSLDLPLLKTIFQDSKHLSCPVVGMSFKIAQKISFSIHTGIALGYFSLPVLLSWPPMMYIGVFLSRVGHFIVCRGCVVTHLENRVSRKIYKKEFRPGYTVYNNHIV
ncbi:hypothetical protein GW864_02650 [bacterium]|nr:hypothetical protein [bacterium]